MVRNERLELLEQLHPEEPVGHVSVDLGWRTKKDLRRETNELYAIDKILACAALHGV